MSTSSMSTLSSRRVAVVIPNWNGATFIARTLTAVLAQTRPADHVVVVDNASTDGSAEFLEPEMRIEPFSFWPPCTSILSINCENESVASLVIVRDLDVLKVQGAQ